MKGMIEIERSKMASYLGDLVEKIAIDHILKNHKGIIKMVYPDQSELNNIMVMRTNPNHHLPTMMGVISGTKSSRLVHGWNGDLVLLFNDKVHGKRAIIFEIKFGRIHLSRSQHEFFKRASVEDASSFMPKLNELKVFIFNCHTLDMSSNQVSFRMWEYMHPNLQEYFKPESTPTALQSSATVLQGNKRSPEPKPLPVKKGKKKRSKKKSKNKMSIIFHKGARSRKAKRKIKRSGDLWE